jgi:hypothetical protein
MRRRDRTQAKAVPATPICTAPPAPRRSPAPVEVGPAEEVVAAAAEDEGAEVVVGLAVVLAAVVAGAVVAAAGEVVVRVSERTPVSM